MPNVGLADRDAAWRRRQWPGSAAPRPVPTVPEGLSARCGRSFCQDCGHGPALGLDGRPTRTRRPGRSSQNSRSPRLIIIVMVVWHRGARCCKFGHLRPRSAREQRCGPRASAARLARLGELASESSLTEDPLTDIIGLLCRQKVFRETSKGRARPDSASINLNEQRCAPQVPDTLVQRAVSLSLMGPYGATRIDLVFPPILHPLHRPYTQRQAFLHLSLDSSIGFHGSSSIQPDMVIFTVAKSWQFISVKFNGNGSILPS